MKNFAAASSDQGFRLWAWQPNRTGALGVLLLGLLGLSLPTSHAHTGSWFTLESSPSTGTLEVDVATLRWHGESREFKVRISYEQARSSGPIPNYRSVLATLHMNCASGDLRWRSASFHPDDKAQASPSVIENYQTMLPSIHAAGLISEKNWSTLRLSACATPRSALR